MTNYQYDKAASHRGFMIIPFEGGKISGRSLFSYVLLSGYGYQHQWHKTENIAGVYAEDAYEVVKLAKAHLDRHKAIGGSPTHFTLSYTYLNNLIVIHEAAGRFYYDHYTPGNLNNIAAPKLFSSEQECIEWVRLGLLRRTVRQALA
ncbi:hypothetical protein [Synechococcus sp. PCC 7336]|uniref:hypothetical protein n=1 Tax=Synechococcus sp. PCC 7336 TaxID=195250 RepID=UPI0004759153|nr:hypothetical protein [Synechococcus sp. PCC 7336]